MKNERNETEKDVLDALSGIVEESVHALSRELPGDRSGAAPSKSRSLRGALPAEDSRPAARSRRTDLSALSLEDTPQEQSPLSLAEAAAAKRAAREALAPDPQLKAADERAAQEDAEGRSRRRQAEKAPAEKGEASSAAASVSTEANTVVAAAPEERPVPAEEQAPPLAPVTSDGDAPSADRAGGSAPQGAASATAPAVEAASPAKSREDKATPGKRAPSRVGRVITGILCILLETILLVVVALYGIMFMLARGPSGTASRLFVRSVRETSAIGFLANLYFSEEEIQALITSAGESEYVETDTDLITMTSVPEHAAEPDAWGFVDEDGDGIILDTVKGEGYSGYMMIVLDPSRVILGTNPATYGSRGYTVEEFVQLYDAAAGINGGAFEDDNGMGTGAYPDGLVIYEGVAYNWGIKQGFAGIDDHYILHVGCQSLEDAQAANIQYGASYGPVLVQNGQLNSDDMLESGLNPRTAIGQRSDGAFLLLVIDGRQVISLGATYLDEAEIMLRYGAVNAINMDGGSSSMMYYNGSYVNNTASVIGIRPIPTSFIVLKEGRG